ncbi:MAG: folate-binding protein, partial [Streptosporangiales bacterium]|nr:folate-binding protein [Streptosporangiales bacterium]
MDSVLLSLPGAVPAETLDAGVAAHYGDPVAEQRALERGVAFVDRGDRGVLTVTGPDRLTWLHSLTSQHLEALAPGLATEALVLDPNGRVEHHMSLVDVDGTVWAHVEPGTAPALAAYLDSMRFMMRVEVADRTADTAVLTLAGPASEQAV